jgi:uncharacterized LabA/DUF88 family protein
MARTAILIDGAFIRRELKRRLGRDAKADNIIEHCEKLMKTKVLDKDDLFRIYYYDCLPYGGTETHPLTGQQIDYSQTPVAKASKQFLRELSLKPSVAFRAGELSYQGWRIEGQRIAQLLKKIGAGGKLDPGDITVCLRQKRVDMKIGLDIAWLASKRIVDKIVLVTGDSDFIPAMKFARREGVIVCVNHMSQHVKEEMLVHADFIIPD